MAYKIKIDNVEYDLRDNFTIKDELNETLDSATIQFNKYGGEANFESFDVAQIYDSNDKISKKYFLVDSFDDEIHSFGSTFATDDHLYTVTLFSETKELERITLPNCSVTQPMSGTRKSVYDEIVRFCDAYIPRIKVYDSNNSYHYSYQRKFSLDSALETRFSSIICPEFQWNNPTLREVLNDLVSTDDCIIVVKQGIISFYDLRQRGNAIDVSKLSFSKKTMSSQDYVGELMIDMQNSIGKSSSLVCEGVSLRAPVGEGSLTTDNGVIKTLQPIYSIKRLRVKCPFIGTAHENDENFYYAWIDITDRVLEKEEFDLLSNVEVGTTTYDALSEFTDQNGVTEKKHKINFLYFKRGGTEIFNFGTPYKTAFTPQTIFRNLAFSYYGLGQIAEHLYGTGKYSDQTLRADESRDSRHFVFYLEYETVAEHALKVGRSLTFKHPDNRVFDNQSNSYVDQEHMSVFEYAKINRLGHKLRSIAGDYYNESDIPQLGDYIGDEILFSREITYQDNIIKFKGMLTPNYVLKDFFTGVRAKKRSWQIAKNEDALTRHDVLKLYVEASFNKKNEWNSYADSEAIRGIETGTILPDLIPIGINNYGTYTLACGILTRMKKGSSIEWYPTQGGVIQVDSQVSILGQSFCIDFGFNDNYKSSDYITSDGNESTQTFYAYADENGEIDREKLHVFPARIKSGSDSTRTLTTQENLFIAINNGEIYPRRNMSIITSDTYVNDHHYALDVNLKKDNREIIQHTLQYEFCNDTKDIIITKRFLERIMFYSRDRYSEDDYGIWLSETKYSQNADRVQGVINTDLKVTRTLAANVLGGLKLTVVDSNDDVASLYEGIKSWAITDANENLLLAINIPNGATAMEVWFNLLRSRDDKIYSDNYNGIPVGDITDAGIAAASTNYAALTTRASTSVNVQGRSILRSNAISGNQNDEEE